MSNNDLAMHLHFALFNGSSGFVLKPIQLRSIAREGNDEVPPSWPARRALLHRTTFSLLSLHQIPKVGTAHIPPIYRPYTAHIPPIYFPAC
jgi:hypothetical protein